MYVNDFIFNPYGSGWHVDRRRFDAMLALAAEDAGAILCRGARLVHCAQDVAGSWEIEITGGHERRKLRAKFLVDATGRASSLARKQGAKRISYDHLIGAVGFLIPNSLEIIPDHCTLVEAVEEGWWYSASLPNFRYVVAYMTDADLYAIGNKRSNKIGRASCRERV